MPVTPGASDASCVNARPGDRQVLHGVGSDREGALAGARLHQRRFGFDLDDFRASPPTSIDELADRDALARADAERPIASAS